DIRAEVVEHATAASPFAHDIRFLGYVPFDDLPPLICGARASIFPSLYEGFGLPILESMACGTPVICSDIPVFREFTTPQTPRFAPKDSQQLCALLAENLKSPRAHAALAPPWTWETCVQHTLECLLNSP
ncbi:MAG: glycosyltransferase, partial [Myxococcota bacterium]